VHLGHLAAAEAVREAQDLDVVVFVPNWQQPLKPEPPRATAAQRLAMVELAIEGNPHFAVSDIELRLQAPAFTVDTLDALRSQHAGDRLQFILGVDAANHYASWLKPASILEDNQPIIMLRAGWQGPDWAALTAIHPRARELVRVVQVPLLAIASQDLRARVRSGQSVRYLVPDRVRDFIERHTIYRLDA
jgi:nicotinate-nucleotide adenylyltransferase